MNKRLLLTIAVLFSLYPVSVRANTENSDIPKEEVSAFESMFGQGPQEEDVYRADRLLVSATGSLKPVRLAPSVASVITSEEIKAIGASTLDDISRRYRGSTRPLQAIMCSPPTGQYGGFGPIPILKFYCFSTAYL